MSHRTMKSNLLVDLSPEEQQLLSGGQMSRRRPIICYTYELYEDYDQRGRGGRGGRGGRDLDIDVDVDVDVDRRRRF
jgi:ABC-type uncharacterized transport system auxiliary subunit